MSSFKLSLHQVNFCVGDVRQNLRGVCDIWDEMEAKKIDCVAFPEMSLSGYPLQDLVVSKDFIKTCKSSIETLIKRSTTRQSAIIVAAPLIAPNGKQNPYETRHNVTNSVIVIQKGQILATIHKQKLPNFMVFDEMRDFIKGPPSGPVNINGTRIGISICEDFWHEDVIECLSETGSHFLLALNASPYQLHKAEDRLQAALKAARLSGLACVYLNLVGAQDESLHRWFLLVRLLLLLVSIGKE
ncbi:MAG: nitrilase-related carbon-nitrogen hydrolase [Pseudomonadota bacterium]